MPEVKFEYNINRVREAIADCENVHTATGKETLNVQPEEYDEGELIDIVSKVVVMKKTNMSQRK